MLARGLLAMLLLSVGPAAPAADTLPTRVEALSPAASPYIDAHVHMDEKTPAASVALMLQAMDRLHQTRAVVQSEPYGPGDPDAWDVEAVARAVKAHPGRLSVMGGGGTLNPMLIQAYRTGDVGPAARARLRARAEAILRQGAIGFGELSNEHFVLPTAPVQDYEYFPADFPLMLELADVAARHGVPIVLHMEAVPTDMASGLPAPNPPALHANFEAFERLLSHNPRAKLIWAHAGADNTGFRTPERMRALLKAHPNLYMEIKDDPGAPGKNPPVVDARLVPAWLQLFSDFPDRFILGSDQHYDAPSKAALTRAQANAELVGLLPAALRRKIAVENPMRLYRLRP